MRGRGWVVGGLLVWLLSWQAPAGAAGTAAHESLALERIYAGSSCADTASAPGIRVAETAAQAERLDALGRGRLVLGAAAGRAPSVDMDLKRLIYIHMGARRTGGYRLDLAEPRADLVDGTLVIPVIWEVPAQGAMVTQALSHPCLLLAIPRDDYQRIEVVDQEGRTRLSEKLSPP